MISPIRVRDHLAGEEDPAGVRVGLHGRARRLAAAVLEQEDESVHGPAVMGAWGLVKGTGVEDGWSEIWEKVWAGTHAIAFSESSSRL